jgi:hypothetical protein
VQRSTRPILNRSNCTGQEPSSGWWPRLAARHGHPARIRCGFAGYFEARRWIDHWVVEYWDGDRWQLTDPQIGRADLTKDDFQVGPGASDCCRNGASRPAAYGSDRLSVEDAVAR